MGGIHNRWITLDEWLAWYRRIVKECGLDGEFDIEAAKILNSLAYGRCLDLSRIRGLVSGKICVIFGAGPSLELDVKKFLHHSRQQGVVKVAADGATVALLEHGIMPDIVVTDLDGPMDSLLDAQRLGSIMVVHAHGDNIELLKQFLSATEKDILPTVQVEPFGCLYNFGGFTDGDRAVFLSSSLDAGAIVLLGMDFGGVIGRYSKPIGSIDEKRARLKLKKLEIGRSLIGWLAKRVSIPIYNMTSFGVDIEGTLRLRFLEEAFGKKC